MNGWYFLATEVDDICFDYAKKNVDQNKLSELIKGKPVLKNTYYYSWCSICRLSNITREGVHSPWLYARL